MQVIEHEPQWLGSLVRSTSHPFAGFMSQSAKPVLHEATVHAPIAHPAVALASEHA